MFCLLSPLEIYASNVDEFAFSIADFFPIFLVIMLVMVCLGAVILSFLPKKISKICNVLIFAFSFVAYVQNMFLNKKLMQNDGSKMVWSELKSYSIINAFTWIIILSLIIIVAYFTKENFEKIVIYTSAFLTIIQLIAVISLLLANQWQKPWETRYSMSGEHQYDLAKNNNVIVLILDRYSNGCFDMLCEEDRSVQDFYKDFTYYNNCDSHYNYTYVALPHILTAHPFDPYEEGWKEEVWMSEECTYFYDTLHTNDYQCNFYSNIEAYGMFGDMANVVGKIDNASRVPLHVDNFLIVRLFEKMTLYKYVPYLLKPKFEVMTDSFRGTAGYEEDVSDYQNGVFYNKLIERGLKVSNEIDNQVTFIHIEGVHEPYTTGADGSLVDESVSNLHTTQMGIHQIMQEYISQLKEMGMYDNSVIIVTADHGWAPTYTDPQPVFLIKQANEFHDELQVSTAPISHDDMLATILDVLGFDYEKSGTSIYDWNDGDMRERTVIYSAEKTEYTYFMDKEELIDLINQDIDNGVY